MTLEIFWALTCLQDAPLGAVRDTQMMKPQLLPLGVSLQLDDRCLYDSLKYWQNAQTLSKVWLGGPSG